MTGFHMFDSKPVSAESAQRDYGARKGQRLVVVRKDTWDAYVAAVDDMPIFASELLLHYGAKPIKGIDDDIIEEMGEE